ncbi:GNAT family N-acetyltransferase [Alsobacter sp. SYSU M60028]|uniref:GNAT family N-acetyltransferase n=1 Tax=Alsobacter ponti TaxID=2962936 RepID=A0ABT1LJJ8_9HYPH|nr:GNAT family N-acetyltransferase [Alsobacter ponti]MCP8940910.1 GNAT family N-acetyltransferase [Alsobacter ponti]
MDAPEPLPRAATTAADDDDIAAALRALRASAGEDAMLVAIYVEGAIHLDLVKVAAPLRRRGRGTMLVRALLALADRFGKPVRLQVYALAADLGGPGQAELERWYERLGFRMSGAFSPTGQPVMIRPAARTTGRSVPGAPASRNDHSMLQCNKMW